MSDLLKARADLVRRYRKHPAGWPDGIGVWFREEDWRPGDDKNGDVLIATGLARAKALDPWANVRAKGEPCPPLLVESHPRETQPRETQSQPRETPQREASESHKPWEAEGVSRATWFRRRGEAASSGDEESET